MELRERLEMQLAHQKKEFARIQKSFMDDKADLDFARGVIRGLEMAMAGEELHRMKESEVIDG